MVAEQDARPNSGAGCPPSRQVSWFEVYRYAARLAAHHGVALDPQLIPGTPQWCGMPDDDARKLIALILGGVREALTNDARQAATAEASKAIARGADWSAAARRIRQERGSAYVPRFPRKRSA